MLAGSPAESSRIGCQQAAPMRAIQSGSGAADPLGRPSSAPWAADSRDRYIAAPPPVTMTQQSYRPHSAVQNQHAPAPRFLQPQAPPNRSAPVTVQSCPAPTSYAGYSQQPTYTYPARR